MSSVDDRIVNMQFNNKQFEAGASQSMKTLTDLEKTLANSGKSTGLEQLGTAADGAASRFSALKVVGVTALATIAHSATQAAGNFLKQFSGMQSIIDGFQEYELKIGSTQVIMANTGETLKTVNARLSELNEYSDKTIYNFADMTKNIGLFTNAGIKLDAATNMIQGFSNEAAVSGTNAAQAAGAAYQLSQALSAGTIRLMDWKSLTNVGMGNANMREGLIELATAMGKFKGDTETAMLAQQNFNGSLEKNWLSADVMQAYLEIKARKLTDAQMKNLGLTEKQITQFEKQAKVAEDAATKVRTWTQLIGTIKESLGSGWAQSIELIIGDFNEATKLFTAINDSVGGVISKMTESRNDLLKEWADEGGRDAVIGGLANVAKALGGIFKAVGEAFRSVFPPSNVNLLLTISKGFKELTDFLAPSEGALEAVKNIFSGLFTILRIGVGVVAGIGSGIAALFKALVSGVGGANLGVLDFLGNIGKLITGFGKWLESTVSVRDVLSDFGTTVGNILRPIISIVSSIAGAFVALASGEGLSGFMDALGGVKLGFVDFVDGVLGGLAELTSPFEGLSEQITIVKEKVVELKNGLSDLAGGTAGAAIESVGNASETAKTSIQGMYSSLKEGASGSATVATEQLSAGAERSADTWRSVGEVLASIGDGIGTIVQGISGAMGRVKALFTDLFGGFDAIDWAALTNAILTGGVLLSIKKFTDMVGDMGGTVVMLRDSVLGVFDGLTKTLKTMQNAIRAKMILHIAIAVGVLTASLIALSFVDPKKLATGLGAIGAMLGMLTTTLALLGKVQAEHNLALLATSILLISAAMMNMAIAIAILGRQDLMVLAKGIGALAFVLGIVVKSMAGLSHIQGKLVAAGASIVLISASLIVLAEAVRRFGEMDLLVLGQGMGAIAFALGLLTVSLSALALAGAQSYAAGAAMVAVAGAMLILSKAVLAFGSMDLKVLAQGMIAVGYALGLMVVSLAALSLFGPMTLVAAGAMVVLAGALAILVPIITALGLLPFEVVVKGITGMALALGVILAAGALAVIVAPGLFALSIAVTALGLATFLAGTGMMLFATGLALAVTVGVAAIAIITLAIQAFMALLPSIAVQVGAAFVSFLEVIAAMSPRIRKASVTIFNNILKAAEDAIPALESLINQLVNSALRILVNAVPQLIDAGYLFIESFLDSVAKRVPNIIESAVDIIVSFLNALGDELPRITDAGFKMIIKFMDGITDAINNNEDELRRAGGDLAWAIIDGMTGGLLSEGIAAVKNAAERLADQIPGPIKKLLGIASPSKVTTKIGEQVAEGLARGMSNGLKGVVAEAVAMANAIISKGNELVAAVQQKASEAQAQAYKMDAQADLAQKRAAKARKAAEKFAKEHPKAEKAIKEREKEAARLEKLSTAQRKKADSAQKKADRAAQKVTDTQTFEESDLLGKADIRENEAITLADKASQMLAQANAEAAEARRLMKTNKEAGRKMLRKARADAREAKRLADEAQLKKAEADEYYRQEVEARVKQMEEDAAYEAADTSGKIAILEARAVAAEAKAKAERETAAALLAQAKTLAETDAAAALRLVEQAEAAAKASEDAANQAKSDRDEIKNLVGSRVNGTDGGSSTTSLSRTAMEDAAKSVDRYTRSLFEATELASSAKQPMQFVQNNYSPEAISASDAYRQGKNLVALAQIKMG